MINAAIYATRALAAEDKRDYATAQYNYTMAAIVETSPKSKRAWQRNADECLKLAREHRTTGE